MTRPSIAGSIAVVRSVAVQQFFGLGAWARIESLEIRWPGRREPRRCSPAWRRTRLWRSRRGRRATRAADAAEVPAGRLERKTGRLAGESACPTALVGQAFGLSLALALFCAVSMWGAKRYEVTGILLKTDPRQKTFVASCAAIPGFMEAMVMPYSVLDEKALNGLQPGMQIEFTLVVEAAVPTPKTSSSTISKACSRTRSSRRLQILEGAGPGPAPLSIGAETVPDFQLTTRPGSRLPFPNSGQGCGADLYLHKLPVAGLLFPAIQ